MRYISYFTYHNQKLVRCITHWNTPVHFLLPLHVIFIHQVLALLTTIDPASRSGAPALPRRAKLWSLFSLFFNLAPRFILLLFYILMILRNSYFECFIFILHIFHSFFQLRREKIMTGRGWKESLRAALTHHNIGCLFYDCGRLKLTSVPYFP